MRDQPSTRNINRSVTGLPMRRVGLPLQAAIDAGAAMEEDDANKQAAFDLLDDWKEYRASIKRLVAELVFNFGYSNDAARAVYDEWIKVQA